MNRDLACAALAEGDEWDLLVIGGGATGLGVALDAQTRGLRTLLVEQGDFASATSSRSTKLIHGGVRYLPQGHFGLVRQALRERALLVRNAPDLVRPQSFLVPATSRWESYVHRAGLLLYDLLEGSALRDTEALDSPHGASKAPDSRRHLDRAFPRARRISGSELKQKVPNIAADLFAGAVRYFDAQFDDAGLAIRLAQVFTVHGGTAINYARVERLIRSSSLITGAVVRDLETDRELEVRARCVVNASGVFADLIRRMDEPTSEPLLTMSRGSHVVVDIGFLTGDRSASPPPSGPDATQHKFGSISIPGADLQDALLVPRTTDGRVLFAIPWMSRLVVGTTDVPVDDIEHDPHPTGEEVDFLLRQLGAYLRHAPEVSDIRSMFAGLRPLLRGPRRRTATKQIPREHLIEVSSHGLVTIAGGKWTTYRLMAAQTVDKAIEVANLGSRRCVTETLPLRVEPDSPGAGRVDETMVRWAVRHQMARTVEDVLARRSRRLFLDVHEALQLAEPVASWMALELGRDREWIDAQVESFRHTAASYLPSR